MNNIAVALEKLRLIRIAADRVNDLGLQQSLLDLQGQLLAVQVSVLEKEVERRELVNEITRLRECRETERNAGAIGTSGRPTPLRNAVFTG